MKESIADEMPDVVIIDETSFKIGDMKFWFWFVLDPESRKIIYFMISRSRTNLACIRLIHRLLDKYGRLPSIAIIDGDP